jgi:hypothetical protein
MKKKFNPELLKEELKNLDLFQNILLKLRAIIQITHILMINYYMVTLR